MDNVDPTSLYSVLIAVVGAVSAILVARYGKKSQDKTTETTNWVEMFKANEAQLKRLSDNVEDLNIKVDRLEAELQVKDKQLWWALTYIRDLVRFISIHHHPGQATPEPPEAIKDLI